MLSRSQLTDYQRKGVQFGVEHENCALYMPMGFGKSVTGLTIYKDLREAFEARRMLISAPLRVARKVWMDELSTWAHLQGLTIARIVGTPSERVAALKTPADIHTVNRENLDWLVSRFVRDGKPVMNWPWDLWFLDECQNYAEQSSVRHKAVYTARSAFKTTGIPRLIEASGTPVPNGYGKLWGQFRLLDGGERLGKSEEAFKERFFDPPRGEFAKWTLKETAAKEIQELIADITFAIENTEPPLPKNFIRVQLSQDEQATYKRMEREYIAEVKGKTLTAVNAGVLDGKLLQLANGAVYTGEGREWVEFHRQKVEALEETIDGISGRIILVYYYRHDLERMEAILRRSERVWNRLRSDRDFGEWAEGRYDIGVLHPASAGHGLNDVYKAGARDLIHFGLTNDLELYDQVNARMKGGHRGKDLDVMLHHIVADNTRDDDYVALLKFKAYDQDDLMRSLARRF